MGIEKFSSEKLKNASEMLKVLAHPVRISIVNYLQLDRKNVTEIYNHIGIEQAVASHHLNLMKSKQILRDQRVGKHTFYELKYEKILDIINCIEKCQPEDL